MFDQESWMPNVRHHVETTMKRLGVDASVVFSQPPATTAPTINVVVGDASIADAIQVHHLLRRFPGVEFYAQPEPHFILELENWLCFRNLPFPYMLITSAYLEPHLVKAQFRREIAEVAKFFSWSPNPVLLAGNYLIAKDRIAFARASAILAHEPAKTASNLLRYMRNLLAFRESTVEIKDYLQTHFAAMLK